MTEPTEAQILDALRVVVDPELHRNIVELGMIHSLSIQDGQVEFTLRLTIPECPLADRIVEDAHSAVIGVPGVKEVSINIGSMGEEERKALFVVDGPEREGISGNEIGRVVAIMSGKGGVGKSMITALLAVALRRAGQTVGLLDADVTGPSIPKMFGVHGPLSSGVSGIEPVISRSGIKLMSVNLLLADGGQAVIWRGPLISGAIQQFWKDVHWGKLDFLLVDLPPGTSDAALTVMQTLPMDGVIMVTTPQSLAALIVRKAVRMTQTVGARVLGVVENMAEFVAPDTGVRYELFGPSHSQEIAEAAGASVLLRLPIDPEMTKLCDAGMVEAIDRSDLEDLVQTLTRLKPALRLLKDPVTLSR